MVIFTFRNTSNPVTSPLKKKGRLTFFLNCNVNKEGICKRVTQEETEDIKEILIHLQIPGKTKWLDNT